MWSCAASHREPQSNILTKPPSIRTLPRTIPPAPEREADPAEAEPQGQPQQDDVPEPTGSASSSGGAQSLLEQQRSRKGLRPGQLDPDVGGELAHRMAELQGRRSYLRNFWYAAGARSHPPACPFRPLALRHGCDTAHARWLPALYACILHWACMACPVRTVHVTAEDGSRQLRWHVECRQMPLV